jgi:hypothetical protein
MNDLERENETLRYALKCPHCGEESDKEPRLSDHARSCGICYRKLKDQLTDTAQELASYQRGQKFHEELSASRLKELVSAQAALTASAQRVDQLEAERVRDALDGQAALDEANNAVHHATAAVEEMRGALEQAVGLLYFPDYAEDERFVEARRKLSLLLAQQQGRQGSPTIETPSDPSPSP